MSTAGYPSDGPSLYSAAVLRRAIRDYQGLLDRGYPEKPVQSLVGDRYRLSRDVRGMLQRGVFSTAASAERAERRVSRIQCTRLCTQANREGRPGELLVDGHNVLFTMWNCRAGRPIIRATDSFIRDVGGTAARLPHNEQFTRLAVELCEVIASLEIPRVRVLLDEQLPWSGEQRAELAAIWERRLEWSSDDDGPPGADTRPMADADVTGGVDCTFMTHRSVDATIVESGTEVEVIATSDTGIIDRCSIPVFDLGGYVVEQIYRRVPRRL
ncbi:MAG: DUF434 domain-containing protein [Spirochaetaceae bacterium]